MEEATKQKWTMAATREISQLQNLYADYARNVGVIWEYVFERVMKIQKMYQEDILYDVVDVYKKLSCLDVEEGEEVELCQVGIRRCGLDSKSMIEARVYASEDYIGGIYKLTVSKKYGLYVFCWYRLREEKF